jgi:glycosyltransferase involved in cell wall biosynthesis
VVVTARGAIADVWSHHNARAYTAISKGMAEFNQPFTDLEIDIVRNSIDVDRYEPPAKLDDQAGPIVAFVGRTTSREKDFPRFTRIASRIKTAGKRIWIADPHKASWEKFAGKSADQMEVERWGPVPHADMPAFYRAVAASGGIVLITSVTEGFGNVAPEAAACGARVAAPRVIGLEEAVLDGVTGMLFAAEATDDDVAARLDEWLASSHDMTACADAARTEFSPSVMVDAYLDVFQRSAPRLTRASATLPPETPALRHLLKHLASQPGRRATFERESAVDLAGAGFRGAAVRALGMAARSAPKQFLNPAAARQVLSVGKRFVTGRGRPGQ